MMPRFLCNEAVWATWDQIVPYMANRFGVTNPAVTDETMKNTDYGT